MRKKLQLVITGLITILSLQAVAQEGDVQTIFKGNLRTSGGYGAVTNKFTTIRGEYTNLAGLYGGWYINHRIMIGIGAAASTNNLHVPQQFSTNPIKPRTWQYGQFGMVSEYVISSDKPIHLAFHLFSGAGFTLQYQREDWDHSSHDNASDENWFVVVEPGVQLEVNLFKWMRLSPGVSYRGTFGSYGRGLGDSDLSAVSYNATMKFGKF
ncbi:MAG TPA: hypothetical protein VKA49_07620 [Flavitalea sp.]|nr:hypothetical protein [Flavitalea sp.]